MYVCFYHLYSLLIHIFTFLHRKSVSFYTVYTFTEETYFWLCPGKYFALQSEITVYLEIQFQIPNLSFSEFE